MDDTTLSVNDRIKKFRESLRVNEKKVSARAFAISLNIDQSHYNKVEKGERNLNEQNYKDISSKYGLNINWLLTGEGEMFLDKKEQFKEYKEKKGDEIFNNPIAKPLKGESLLKYVKRIIRTGWLPNQYTSDEIIDTGAFWEKLEEMEKEIAETKELLKKKNEK